MMFISIKMELDFFACINFSAFERCSCKTNREWWRGLRGGCDEQELKEGNSFSTIHVSWLFFLQDCLGTAEEIAIDNYMSTFLYVYEMAVWLTKTALFSDMKPNIIQQL